ncbi:cytochrome c551 [Bacillus kexueae]|uniref:cytochrome c551 n=1 Tax=Aeribacillus kexueae TaxID=2078952 RepID=UPI001FAE7EBE
MKKKLTALLLGTSLALTACGTAEDKTGEENNGAGETTASAEELFKGSCAGCHGQNLQGGAGPQLTEVGAKYSEDEIKSIIVNGQGGMPGGILNESEAAVVAEWLAAKK